MKRLVQGALRTLGYELRRLPSSRPDVVLLDLSEQERRTVTAAGVEFTRKVGRAITHADWAYFYRCYENTYREHGSTPYLSLEFFERIGASLPYIICEMGTMSFSASRAGARPACAVSKYNFLNS